MFIRFLKVILALPFLLMVILYYTCMPLWYILFGHGFDDVMGTIDSYATMYSKWGK